MKTPINNGLAQSDLDFANFKARNTDLSDYAGANLDWNATTKQFDATGGGGGGGGGLPYAFFNLKTDFAAKGDGHRIIDAVMNSGSATLTAASGPFANSDIGKIIHVANAKSGPNDLVTTITGYTSPTTVTLGASATNSVSGVNATFGSDDTTALQNAVNAATAITQRTGRIFCPVGIYMIGGAMQTTGGYNTQIKLPNIDVTNPSLGSPPVLILQGESPLTMNADYGGVGVQQWPSNKGTTFFTTGTGTGTRPSFMGAPLLDQSHSFPATFTWLQLIVQDILFKTYANPTISMLDFFCIWGLSMYNVSVMTDNIISWPEPMTAGSTGIVLPAVGNSSMGRMACIDALGFYTGIRMNELMDIDTVSTRLCKRGIQFDVSNHCSRIGRWLAYGCQELIYSTVGAGQVAFVSIEQLNQESINSPAWAIRQYDIDDPNNGLYGYVNYHNSIYGTGPTCTWVANGGANFKACCLKATANGWTTPTGTDLRSGYATSTATITQVAQTLKSLITDLTTLGVLRP